MAQIKVIFKPYAGRGHGHQIEARLIAALETAGFDFDLAETAHPGHGIEL